MITFADTQYDSTNLKNSLVSGDISNIDDIGKFRIENVVEFKKDLSVQLDEDGSELYNLISKLKWD